MVASWSLEFPLVQIRVSIMPVQVSLAWSTGGQREFVDRMLQGFDDNLIGTTQQHLGLNDQQCSQLRDVLKQNGSATIPYQFLSLQDCVDVAIFCIRATVA